MAGYTYPGRNMWVAVGIQTSMTTLAQVFSYIQPTEVGGFLEEFATIDSNRRLGTRFSGAPYVGTKTVPFSFTAEADPNTLPRILLAAMGAEYTAPSVTSVVHNHTFRFAEDLPYITVLGYLAGVADATSAIQSIRLRGAKISQLTLRGSIDEVMTVAIEGIAMTASACSSTTTAFSLEDPFFLNATLATGLLSIGSTLTGPVAFEEAREYELVINNNLQPDHRIHGSNSPVGIEEGSSEITGRMVTVMNHQSWAEINNFIAGNDRALALTVTAAKTTYSLPTTYAALEVALGKVRYSGDSPSFDPDVITVEMPFKAELPTLTSTWIAVKNNKSLMYSAAI
ncbi:MAG: phage tail tube protein [Gallionellaceae bacterium]|nr:phage tail tube protein [Gallionellaceae bacterium]